MISGKPCVLVVDDDPVSLGFLAAALDQCGCAVVRAGGAGAALALLPMPGLDLLLIDRNMPDGDGIALLHRLRALGVAAPAIASSAEIEPPDLELLQAAGFAATLHKPASLETIRALLGRFVDLAAPPFAPDVDDARATRADALIDDTAALAVIGGDRTALRALRGLFAGELDSVIDLLQHDPDATGAASFAERLHRLRASCGFCGAAALGEAAAALERCLRRNEADRQRAQKLFLRACVATRTALAASP